jgi:ferredoxin, 2Fe-2S
MVKITYVEFNGTAHSVNVAEGENLMEGALINSVPGIDGDCGGNAACATCHCYVPEEWAALTGERSELEGEMLELADGAGPTSRLACQIVASADLDGLVVSLPETQH